MTATIIDGKALGARVREEVAASVAELGHVGLATILVGDDPVEQLTRPPRRAGCPHSGGAGPYGARGRGAGEWAKCLLLLSSTRGSGPDGRMHRRAPMADNTGEILNSCLPRASICQP